MKDQSVRRRWITQVSVAGVLSLAAAATPGWANDQGAKPEKYHDEIKVFLEARSGSWDASPEIAAIGSQRDTTIKWRITTPGFVFMQYSFHSTDPNTPFRNPQVSANGHILTIDDDNDDYCLYSYTLYVYDALNHQKKFKVDPQIKNGSTGLLFQCGRHLKKRHVHIKR
jgi:hypothetical protein